MEIKIVNNTEKIKKEFGDKMGKALYAIGVEVTGDVTEYMSEPDFTGKDIVDTGRLRASMSFITPEAASGANGPEAKEGDAIKGQGEENTVIAGTNVEYADEVNNGTNKQAARRFMENSIEPNYDKYKEIAADVFKGKR